MKLLKLFLISILLYQKITLDAYEPYHAIATVSATSTEVSAPNLVDLSNELRTASLEQLLPLYTPTSAFSIGINLRGIGVLASFATNSTTLVIQIPQAGTTETFTGGTRDESIQLFRNYIQNAGKHHRLLRAYSKYSPIDPIAGNPNSLIAQMAQADYLTGHLSPLSGCDCNWNSQPVIHQFQAGLDASRAFSKPYDTTTVTLPLRYSYSPQHRSSFIIDAPITYNRNGGASSLFGSLGLGFRFSIRDNWHLTSILRGGTGGSADLCTAGCFASGGLLSVYDSKWNSHVFSITNYAGYFSSTNFWLSGINFNYKLHNWILKNGFSLTSCAPIIICKKKINYIFSFIDSYFTKDRIYINHYDEVSVSLLATCVNPRINYDSLSFGFAYQFGEKNYKGYALKMIYQF